MSNWTLEKEKQENVRWNFKMQNIMSLVELPFCDAFRKGTFIKSWR